MDQKELLEYQNKLNAMIANEDAVLRKIVSEIQSRQISIETEKYIALSLFSSSDVCETAKSLRLRIRFFGSTKYDDLPKWVLKYKKLMDMGLDTKERRIVERVRADLHKKIGFFVGRKIFPGENGQKKRTEQITFKKEKTLQCIRDLAEKYTKETGQLPRVLVDVSRATIILRNMRNFSIENMGEISVETEIARFAKELELESGYAVDVLFGQPIWGKVSVKNVEPEAVVSEIFYIAESCKATIAATSPEALFVLKTASIRKKDRRDLPKIFAASTKQKILDRAFKLFEMQEDPFHAEEMLLNVVSEIQFASGEAIDYSDIPALKNEKIKELLTENFGIVLNHKKTMLSM